MENKTPHEEPNHPKYGVGALAYLGELMAMTHMFKKRVDGRELLMPILFGVMYIMLGFSYAIEHYHLFG